MSYEEQKLQGEINILKHENERLREHIKRYTEQHVRLLNEILRELAVKENEEYRGGRRALGETLKQSVTTSVAISELEDDKGAKFNSVDDLMDDLNDDVIIRLCAKNERLRAAFRVNMLRAFPHMSHEEIDAEINRVENEE